MTKSIDEDKTTYIEEVGIYQCNFCGAYAESAEKIEHYATCTRAKGMEQYENFIEDELIWLLF